VQRSERNLIFFGTKANTAAAGSGPVTIDGNKNKNKNSTNPSTTAAAADGGPVTIDGNSNKRVRLDDPNFWMKKMMQMKRGCNICKEARKLCKGCKYGSHKNCMNCYNEDIHCLFKYNSYEKCICDNECLELLLEKKEAIEENRKLVHSLYLIREQKSPGERYNPKEGRRYGCLQPDFIWVIFRKFMNPIPDIPSNYISDRELRLIEKREKEDEAEEEEMAKRGLIRCPCGCQFWIPWQDERCDKWS